MQITIPCNVYARMAEVPAMLDATDPRQYLKCLYFERKNNQLFIVVTNAQCGAMEYLGRNDGPDECTAIPFDQSIMRICEQETQFGSLMIEANELLRYTKLSTTLGGPFTFNGYHPLPDNHQFKTWREWFPAEQPTQSFGTMYWNAAVMWSLCSASKSGGLKFPQFIDVRKPVLINDADSSDWIGVFMPTQKGTDVMPPVVVPDWV